MFSDDLAALFAEEAITVSAAIGSSRTRGFLDWKDVLEQDDAGGFVTVSRQVLTIVDGSLVGCVFDATIVVDGNTRRIRDVRHVQRTQLEVILA